MQRKNGIKNRIEHTKLLCFAGVLCVACFLCACTKREELLVLTEEAASQEIISETAEAEDGEAESTDSGGASDFQREEAAISQMPVESGILYVHVCGAVEMPGVYELPAGSRVYEAIQAAGGFSENAGQNYVNQAQILSDGVKLVIPTVEEAAAADSGAADGGEPDAALQPGIIGGADMSAGQADTESVKSSGGRININTATEQELCTIPGVGKTRAAAIISYRESHGGFAKPEDIMQVNGIKEGMYEKIKDHISVK